MSSTRSSGRDAASLPRATEALCPSARCEEGAILLGLVAADGRVAYLRPEARIDAEFVREARRGRAPEKRFRFADTCVEGRCAQWTGERCGLIDRVLESEDAVANGAEQRPLPRCAIRTRCRWFGQQGREACAACPLVVHDVSGSDR